MSDREGVPADPQGLEAQADRHEAEGRLVEACLVRWQAGLDCAELGRRIAADQAEAVAALLAKPFAKVAVDGERRGTEPWDIAWELRFDLDAVDRPVLAATHSRGDEAVELVAQLDSLVWLDLARHEATPEGLGALERLPQLRTLRVTTALVEPTLKTLGRLRSLEELDLEVRPPQYGGRPCETLLEDAWIEHLVGLERLRDLNLRGHARLTDACLDTLTRAEALRTLRIGCSAGFTPEGVRRLRAACPDLRIEVATCATCQVCVGIGDTHEDDGYAPNSCTFLKGVHRVTDDGGDTVAIKSCPICGGCYRIAHVDMGTTSSYRLARYAPAEAKEVLGGLQGEGVAEALARVPQVAALRAACDDSPS